MVLSEASQLKRLVWVAHGILILLLAAEVVFVVNEVEEAELPDRLLSLCILEERPSERSQAKQTFNADSVK